MSIFVGRYRKPSIIRIFPPGLLKISDTTAGYPCDRLRWDSLYLSSCAFSASFRSTLLAISAQSLINSTFFAAIGNNTLELIGNWIAEVIFRQFNSETLDNLENVCFPNYRGFRGIDIRLGLYRFKYTTLNKKKTTFIFFVSVIA